MVYSPCKSAAGHSCSRETTREITETADDDDERFLIYRTAYWIDEGLSIDEAKAKAQSELPFKATIEIPKKAPAPSIAAPSKRRTDTK
jgi:hypothetical protein